MIPNRLAGRTGCRIAVAEQIEVGAVHGSIGDTELSDQPATATSVRQLSAKLLGY
jgi:hypothetical protein